MYKNYDGMSTRKIGGAPRRRHLQPLNLCYFFLFLSVRFTGIKSPMEVIPDSYLSLVLDIAVQEVLVIWSLKFFIPARMIREGSQKPSVLVLPTMSNCSVSASILRCEFSLRLKRTSEKREASAISKYFVLHAKSGWIKYLVILVFERLVGEE